MGSRRVSSKRRLRYRACRSKVRHATEAEAFASIVHLKRKGHYDGEPLNVYRCRFCNGFHFGHTPREVRQAMAERRAAHA